MFAKKLGSNMEQFAREKEEEVSPELLASKKNILSVEGQEFRKPLGGSCQKKCSDKNTGSVGTD